MKDSIKFIDDLKYQLKRHDSKDEIIFELNQALNRIINIFVLDQDEHAFASAPKSLPPKIKAYPTIYNTKDINQWHDELLEWVPFKLIRLSDFIDRCLNNLNCEIWEVNDNHIKSAILSLKEDGKIEFDEDWVFSIKRI